MKKQNLQDRIIFKHFERVILPALLEEGFAVPSRRDLERALTSGLEPLQKEMVGRNQCRLCSFHHLLNLLWQPIIDYIEALSQDAAPDWTQSLGLNQAAIVSEMQGLFPGAEESMDMDQWVELIQKTLQRLLSVHVPTRLIMQVLSPMVPLSLQPTPATALHLLRSQLCGKLVGPALAAQASRLILSEIAEVPVRLIPEQDLNLQIRENLIASLEQQHCAPDEAEADAARQLLAGLKTRAVEQRRRLRDTGRRQDADAFLWTEEEEPDYAGELAA